MRTEEREVLVKKTVYIADDGREFDDEDDCLNYECDAIEEQLKGYCYDHKLNEISVDRCEIAYLPTEMLVKAFIRVCDDYGCVTEGIAETGIYMYSDYAEGWINLDTIASQLKEVLSRKGDGE